METNSVLSAVLEDFPVLVCVVAKESYAILYCNRIARQFMKGWNVDGYLSEAGKEAFFLQPMEATDIQPHYDVKIKGHWFLFTDIQAAWTGGEDVHILIGIDETENKKSEQALRAFVFTDSMTGIFNRKAGIDTLEEYVGKHDLDGIIFAVCYFDLNDLKYANDTFGHAVGDAYIQNVVSLILCEIRHNDIFARMGGDEFLLIFPGRTYEAAEGVAQAVTNKLDIINSAGVEECRYSISYGVLGVGPGDYYTAERILNVLDSKMYYMKEEYRRTKGNRRKDDLTST